MNSLVKGEPLKLSDHVPEWDSFSHKPLSSPLSEIPPSLSPHCPRISSNNCTFRTLGIIPKTFLKLIKARLFHQDKWNMNKTHTCNEGSDKFKDIYHAYTSLNSSDNLI